MQMIEYTPEFFRALEALIDKRPHKCKGCGIADGEHGYRKDQTRKKFPAVVRLCIDDPSQAKNDASNVAMFCTRCRKPNQEWRTPRRIKPSNLPQIFLDRSSDGE